MEGLLFFALLSKDLFFYGTLDYYCVRPMPIFACASAHNLQIEECLNALVFIAVGGAACAHLGLLDKPITLFFLFIGMLASLLVWLGIALFVSCAAVWFGQTSAIWQGLSAMYEHAKYPLDILPLPLQILLTVVPLGFTAYYPVRYALQAQEHVWLGLIAPTVGIAVAGLAYAVYRKAVHQYESTGGVDPSA
jgi:ABC-2 type transport system permease protein